MEDIQEDDEILEKCDELLQILQEDEVEIVDELSKVENLHQWPHV